MKPDFGVGVEGSFRGRPAHISTIDFILWNRFRRLSDVTFTRIFFDVAVGEGAPSNPGVPDPVRLAWTRITRQRIDVVGERSVDWTIIEIRAAAGPGAIGSLVVYRDLWFSDPPDSRPVTLWLVTDIFPENLRRSLDLAKITLFLV